jgi:uncharacterized membrane protein
VALLRPSSLERLSGPNWLGVCLISAGALLVAYKGEPC